MTLDLNQAAADIAADREEIIERLVQFSARNGDSICSNSSCFLCFSNNKSFQEQFD